MRQFRTLVAVTIGLAFLAVNRSASTEPAKDEAAIRQIIANWDQGWKVFDAELTTRGYASDATHIHFTDFAALRDLADRNGLTVVKSYSFPFPRRAGRLFIYNEFNVLAQKG